MNDPICGNRFSGRPIKNHVRPLRAPGIDFVLHHRN